MPFFVLWEDPTLNIAGVSAARKAFATMEEAEDAVDLMKESSSTLGHATPDYRIIDAPNMEEAFFLMTGVRGSFEQ